MILRALTIHNYGTFRGEQRIDLTTRPGKPIILFGGKNGCGKTTLLEALRLCLYGPASAGERISREAYATFLSERIHNSPALLVQPSIASIKIEFQHADVGRLQRYEVLRCWERSASGRISERLEISRDGQAVSDVSNEQWQDFIRELIPPGVARLFFFDGERIQQLAEDSTDQRELAVSVKSLLGTDIVERLQADLSIYRTRLSKPARTDAASAEFQRVSDEVASREARIRELEAQRSEAEAQLAEVRDAIARVEQRIKAEGGAFARNRDTLISSRENAKARIQTLEQAIRQLCQGVLPFSLAKTLCTELRARLLWEEEHQRQAAGRELLGRAEAALVQEIESRRWCLTDAALREEHISRLAARLSSLVQETCRSFVQEGVGSGDGREIIHHLSSSEGRQLLLWIDQALTDVPERMRRIASELEEECRTLHRAEDALKRIPADDVLAPHLEELQALNKRYGELGGQVLAHEEAIRSERLQLADLRRRLADQAEKLGQEATHAQRVRVIAKIQAVLEDFRERLLVRKTEELEQSVTECFNLLSRKTDAVKRATIDPKNFAVVLFDRENNPVPKERLSAGEKQVYAIAMLWALARTSGRPLPVIIDTPLGRLDSDHRKLLVERYFPCASHQVILLSTDTEVDKAYFESLRRYVTSAYRLEFDMRDRCTNIEQGYFFATNTP